MYVLVKFVFEYMESKKLVIKVIAGSTREGRFSDKAATWIAEEFKKHDNVEVEVLDLRDYEMPFFDSSVSPSFKQEPYTNDAVARFTKKIAEGEAFVVVTPEYNRGTSAVLKNALDWVYQEWGNKPIAFVAYGSVGGARAVEQLRLNAIELQMAPIREAIHFEGSDYFPMYFGGTDPEAMFAKYSEKAQSMAKQLVKWGEALRALRN